MYEQNSPVTKGPTKDKEKILLAESDPIFGAKVNELLKKYGYEVIWTKTGTDTLKSLYNDLPHLVILEVSLPDIDGYSILEKKYAETLLQNIPLFLLSIQGAPLDMRRIPKNSVTEYVLAYHGDPNDVVSRVNSHFGKVFNSPTQTNNKRLLWVEDDKLIGTILGKKLNSSGFDVVHAENGFDALKALEAFVPDAIVLDILLPGMNGFDLLQKIRLDQRFKMVPVMILSNLSKPSDLEKARILGIKKFIVKASSSLEQIVEEVRELSK